MYKISYYPPGLTKRTITLTSRKRVPTLPSCAAHLKLETGLIATPRIRQTERTHPTTKLVWA
jgi:hypothetical protein